MLPAAQPLYMDYGLVAGSSQGPRPHVVVELNGREAARIPVARPFAKSLAKIPLAHDLARAGDNVISIGPGFDLEARIQNYYGIAPDFPRVFVVSDVTERLARRGAPGAYAFRAVAVYGGCVLVLFLAGRLLAPGSATPARSVAAIALSFALVPVMALAYSLLTPQHIWLSPEAVGVAGLVVFGLGATALAVYRQRRRATRIAAVVAVTVLSLEVALRLFNAVRPHFLFYSDSYDRFRGLPGAPMFDSRLNARGFNDVNHSIERRPGTRQRIVALGDSFAVGVVPYSANYLTLLESELAPDGSVEVINMGMSATGPSDYRDILVREGLEFGPDVVLVSVFVGNDLEVRARRPHEYSYVAMLASGLWRLTREQTPAPQVAAPGAGAYVDERPGFSRERFMEIEVDRAWIYEPASTRVAAAVARAATDLRSIREIASRARASIVVVLIPDEAQVDSALRSEIAGLWSADVQLDFDQPQRLLSAALADDGIRVVDLLPVFRDAGAVRLYKPFDTHWNLAGNRLAAQAIARVIRDAR